MRLPAQRRSAIVVEETQLPVRPAVHAACELLGLDPMFVANEGKLAAFVAPEAADAVLAAMRSHKLGAEAQIIGRVVAEHPRMLVAHTRIGSKPRDSRADRRAVATHLLKRRSGAFVQTIQNPDSSESRLKIG